MSLFNNLFQQSKSSNLTKQLSLKLIETKGFPSKKDENWKYTSLKNWVSKDYQLASSEGAEFKIQSQDTFPIVFVNGNFQVEHSVLPDGVQVQSMAKSESSHDSFQALSNLNSEIQYKILIQKNVSLSRPIEIILISASQASEAYTSSEISIHVEEGSSVAILEHHLQHGSGHLFIFHSTKISTEKNSKLEFLQLQNVGLGSFHLHRSNLEVLGPGTVRTCVLSLGALQSRSELDLEVRASDVSAEVLGVYALNGHQQSDHYTNMNHHVGGSQTTQLYKGLLDQNSKAVFNGGVFIAKNAQKANSEQLNKNLLLSDKAEINSKPQLQIYADDVKAAHGSTIGQLQKEELFYLQSRAITKAKAIDMLSQAFVMDVIERLENATLKKEAKKALKAKIAGIL